MSTNASLPGLEWINTGPEKRVLAELTEIFGSELLAKKTLAHAPFSSILDLCETSQHLLDDLSHQEILGAINAHPGIGGRVEKGTRSAREQQAALSNPAALEEIARLSETYRQRFGYTFLIRAAGRPSQFIAAELQRRLGNDPTTEWTEAKNNLSEINRLRLTSLSKQGAH